MLNPQAGKDIDFCCPTLRGKLIYMIQEETVRLRVTKKPAAIWAKLNALVDVQT